jgi:poly-gamma-glutamate capsule biosynthesis protein CapA/YwtB (metallophosphatase superfamily)
MNKTIIVLFIFISLGLLTYYVAYENGYITNITLNDNITPTPIPVKMIEKKSIFVAVSDFKNLKSHYTYGEILDSELITLEEYSNYLPESIISKSVFVQKEDLKTEIESGKIAILKPEDVNADQKTLFIDDQLVWKKNFDISKYPLSYTYEIVEGEDDPLTFKSESIYSFFAGGEIIPARAVDRLGLNVFNNYTYLFDFFEEDLNNAVLNIALLENSLLGDPKPCTGCVMFTGDDQVAKGLADTGFNFLSTAGNHAGDAGQKAYGNTIDLLKQNNIAFTGTGKTQDDLLTPAIATVNNRVVGMLAADDIAYFFWGKNTNDNTYGTNSFAKVSNGITSIDKERVALIRDIKIKYNIDYLIIYMSWGIEYTNKPTTHQQNLAKELIDNGADLIIGSHPHWVQSIDFYNNVPIIYSMGNFIFDQTHTLPTRQGMNINFYYYQDKLVFMELMPHQVCGYHQTKNNLTQKYLNQEISKESVYEFDEIQGCVYWQPKKLKNNHPGYEQILKRVFEYSKI